MRGKLVEEKDGFWLHREGREPVRLSNWTARIREQCRRSNTYVVQAELGADSGSLVGRVSAAEFPNTEAWGRRLLGPEAWVAPGRKAYVRVAIQQCSTGIVEESR